MCPVFFRLLIDLAENAPAGHGQPLETRMPMQGLPARKCRMVGRRASETQPEHNSEDGCLQSTTARLHPIQLPQFQKSQRRHHRIVERIMRRPHRQAEVFHEAVKAQVN